MKINLQILVIILVIPFVFSCSNNTKNSSVGDSDKTADAKKESEKELYNPGKDYKLVWADEFDGDSINADNWNYQVEEAGRFNDEWQRYTNSIENAYIEDGCMVIKAIHESDVHGMDQYTSARMNTANKQSWKYGKIVAKIKLPYGTGMWPAFWMLGANIDENGGDTPWPHCGEIDILELYGSRNDSVVEANIHFSDSAGEHGSMGAVGYHLKDEIFADDFHVFELDWNSTRVTWLVDGNEFGSFPIKADYLSEFHKEHFILFNVAVGNKWAGRPDSTSVFPQFMHIDWVRVYQKKE